MICFHKEKVAPSFYSVAQPGSGQLNSAHVHNTLSAGHCAGPQKSNTALEFRMSTNQTSFSRGAESFFWGEGKPHLK